MDPVFRHSRYRDELRRLAGIGIGTSASLHYASTPALNASNSVESRSVNSDDCCDAASSSDASSAIYYGRGGGCGVDSLAVTEDDVAAIESCYSGNATRVFVSRSMANLYVSARSATRVAPTARCDTWTLAFTGVPVLLLDAGATRSRSRRRVQLVLAEKGTCFALWRDEDVDGLGSRYTCQTDLFHVMHPSADPMRRVGLSFDSRDGARDFHRWVCMLTADTANNHYKKNKKNVAKSHKRYRKPAKAEISLPCAFQHVVSVDREDGDRYYSMKAFVGSNNCSDHGNESGVNSRGTATTATLRRSKWGGSSPNVHFNNSYGMSSPPSLSTSLSVSAFESSPNF